MSYGNLGHEIETAYQSGSHSRSQSETRAARITDNDRLLDQSRAVDDLYDPHTRTGRPSFAQSATASPRLHPAIHVHEPEKMERELDQSSLPPRPRKTSRSAKFLARLRFLEVLIAFIASLLVVGVNAAMLYTYNQHHDAVKWVDLVNSVQKEGRPVWPLEGIDSKPITAYIAIGSLNAVITLVMLVLSFRKQYRYLDGTCATISLLITSAGLFVLWLLIAILLQYQAMGNSGKHSFLTWTCTHTGESFALPSFSFANLCNLTRTGRSGGLVLIVANFVIFLTVLFSCCSGRKSKGYTPVISASQQWMPKWGRK